MAAILGLDITTIQSICSEVSINESMHVQCANINSPSQTVISGNHEAVEITQELCLKKGAKRALKLNVSIASHSLLMKSLHDEFHKFLSTIEINIPLIPVIHNVDNNTSSDLDAIKNLLVEQLYSPVQWVNICNKIATFNLPAN